MYNLHKSYFNIFLFLVFFFSNAPFSSANDFFHYNDNDPKDVSSDINILPSSIKKIVIDAGHGGKDNGCSIHHVKEKEINLKIAIELGEMLKSAFSDLEIIYTRDCDKFVSLDERIKIANQQKADLFISIHCNYVKEKEVSGSETFVLGEEYRSIDAHVHTHHAMSKGINQSIHQKISNHVYAKSIDIAYSIEQSIKKIKGYKSRGIKQAAFTVLKETEMPSVLVEAGFLSNNSDKIFLNSPKGQKNIAYSLFNACLDYFKTLKQREAIIHSPQVVIYHKTEKYIQESIKTEQIIKYHVRFAEFVGSPVIDNSEKWKNLGSVEIIQENNHSIFFTPSYLNIQDALTHKTFLEKKGFKGAYIVIDSRQ